jgi:hypothetical protein
MQPNPSDAVPTAPTPGSGAPAPADPVVEFIRADRQSAGYVLLGLATLLLIVCGYTVFKAARPIPAQTEPEKEKKADDPFSLDEGAAKPKDPNRTDYYVGAVISGAGALLVLAAAVWLLVGVPAPTDARQRSDARALILAVGGLLGALLIVAGVWYAVRWNASLADWLDKGKTKEAVWVLYPLLMIVGGAGLMFLAAQPARAEERNNGTLRKFVYGSNMGLMILLLFVALVVLNLFLSPRLPNKLDVTESGFYSLSEGTREFLGRMTEPATAYAILPEGGSRTVDDIRRLLQNCQDASGGKFQVKTISPVSNKSEFRALAAKYPVLENNETGVLLTVGADEKRHTFIRDDEFTQRDAAAAPGQEGGRSFIGEAKLMRELLFLTESEKKAVVYFTQSAGELALDPGGEEPVGPEKSAARLKGYLEKSYLDVRPLRFDPVAPKVPDDATVVVIAEPTAPLSEPQVAALRAYMTEGRGGKKGKLVVLAGAQFDPAGRVIRTGLEKLLAEFNVRLGDRVIVGTEDENFGPLTMIVGFNEGARRAKHPVAVALGEKAAFMTPQWRPVGVGRDGGPNFRALPLLVTAPGRVTWLEDERPRDLNRIFAEFRANPAIMRAKELTENPRPVGVVVTETAGPGSGGTESGRVAVFGSGLIVSDGIVRSSRDGDPITFDLVGGTIDWLRDRPPLAIGVEAKKYKTFTLPPTADETRGLWFPLLFALMVVTGLGMSVWMVRRRTA